MLRIDGSKGEGGGQVLRTSLALSLVTGTPFTMTNIRAGRAKPGLLRQHLTAVKAAEAVGAAEVSGAELGSRELTFHPRALAAGNYHFAVGTAGSATLVLQTVLPALLAAKAPSTLMLEGGTHNPAAPPFDFLARAYLPLLRRMGADVAATLDRPGFFPAGGGKFRVDVRPQALKPLSLMSRGRVLRREAKAVVSMIPFDVAKRELETVGSLLELRPDQLRPEELKRGQGPGNALVVEVESEHVTEVFTGFGERGKRAETVAEEVAAEVKRYLNAEVPVGEHLCDQLLLLCALARGGEFRTLPLDGHALTQLETMAHFLDVKVDVGEVDRDVRDVVVRG
ncbi:RNA 3'-terminal phosphate cyclase [Myxococcus sp. MISCRS1]|uniref:RNA 3'-terminal phosphate cyclase n=1 Tax=Myxococcus TaxID=32 RepID=UPI00200B7E9C|nr:MULTISPECIES: RNA 3'-terminal phosphate cyclase [Myxococcus]MCK8500581.1 RNA 3'-terminal phosphate cyclase [Myxococcus fulvus]MCY1002303.1 RNA 3'-terminal phosphate cyclase [Myxococcus sp. MISCRS1]BDT36125.1 RNA 3'-terminal phosphate cyclase [Myxococcus sp. MH1]